MRQTAKYIAGYKTAKAQKLGIRKTTTHQELYLKLIEAGYEWNPEKGWVMSQTADMSNPQTGLIKIRLIVATPYVATITAVIEGMLKACPKPFIKVDGPSISPSRKEEGFSLIYFTFQLPGYHRKFIKQR